MLQYSWYRSRMIEVIAHVRECFPDTDILLLGVSDKSYQGENGYETMPAVLAMLHTQRQIARQTGTPSGMYLVPWEEKIVWFVM